MGEAKRKALAVQKEPIALDAFGGRIHVEWDPAASVTPLWQLPFFIEFLKVSGLFDAWVADCPLTYQSNNAPDKRVVLATFLRSILAGHHRYAHITAIRNDGSALSSWVWRDESRRMARGWMSPRALPGSTGTWRRRRGLCLPRRGSGIWMRR